MAYIKYRELTKNFYFYKESKEIPSYADVFIMKNEKLIKAYKTKRDIGLFTTKRIILFDYQGLGNKKETTIIPLKSVSSSSILYQKTTVTLLLFLDSGYPVTLKFIKQTGEDKKQLRLMYQLMNEYLV